MFWGRSESVERRKAGSNFCTFSFYKKPYGNYSPDWAVVCRKEALANVDVGIYFIVETKTGKTEATLQEVERNKIRCGKLHFEAVSNQIKFDWVKSYDDFRNKFGIAESN